MFKIIGGDGKEYGPVAADMLRQWLAEGRLNAQTRVLPEGATEWKTLGELPEFAPREPAATARPVMPGPISLPAVPRNNSMAIASLVLGILSVTIALCCYGLPFNVLGIIFSLVALQQIKADPQNQRGSGMAVAGLVLSIISLVFAGLLLAFYLMLGPHRLPHRFYRL